MSIEIPKLDEQVKTALKDYRICKQCGFNKWYEDSKNNWSLFNVSGHFIGHSRLYSTQQTISLNSEQNHWAQLYPQPATFLKLG